MRNKVFLAVSILISLFSTHVRTSAQKKNIIDEERQAEKLTRMNPTPKCGVFDSFCVKERASVIGFKKTSPSWS